MRHYTLREAEVLAHATVEQAVAPTAAELAAIQDALAGWSDDYVGDLRNIQSGATAEGVVIGIAWSEVGEVQVDRVTFHDADFDRSDLRPEWDEIEELPCDHARLVMPVALNLQFGSGPAVVVEGELELWNGNVDFHAPELSFKGIAVPVTLADHHAVLSSLDTPAEISVVVGEDYGLIQGGGERWVEFGTGLEAESD